MPKASPFSTVAPSPLSHEKAKADLETVTNDLLREATNLSKPLDPTLQARGFEQLHQLYELQQQLQGRSAPGGSVSQGLLPPAGAEALSAQQQYYNFLLQQQQGRANQIAPAQHQNGPGYQHWGASLSPWSHPSLFGGLGFSAPQQSGFFGANPAANQGLSVTAQGPTLQEGRVNIPLPKPAPSDEQGLSAPSFFAAPPVPNRPETSQGLGSFFGSRVSPAPGEGSPLTGGVTRTPPPGFGPPGTNRPPPGFGPPAHQRPDSLFAANGVASIPNKALETPPVDDYKWLDGYTHAKPQAPDGGARRSSEHFSGEYAIGEPSIWGRGASPISEWGGKPPPEEKKVAGQTYPPSAYETRNPFVP